MPDVKPRPRAGAIRLSLIRADQKGTGSASEFVIVACIPGVLALTAGPRRKPILTPTSRRLHNGLRPKCPNRKKVGLWSVLIQQNLSCSRPQDRVATAPP